MVFISIKNEPNKEGSSNSKQYLLRVVYDSEDKNVHKLLEGIFGPNQMLDVQNGKIAKVNSSLTPKERDCFLSMVSEALKKMEVAEEDEFEEVEENKDYETNEKDEIFEEDNNSKEDSNEKDLDIQEESSEEEIQDSRKVSAEKLIKEFANFLNSIS